MTHRGPFQPLPFCDSVFCDSVSNIHTTCFLMFGHQWKAKLSPDLFPGLTRTSDPPAMEEAQESSGESRVSKHPTCWVLEPEAALGLTALVLRNCQPCAEPLHGTAWQAPGLRQVDMGKGLSEGRRGPSWVAGQEQEGLKWTTLGAVQAGGGTTCKEANPHKQKLAYSINLSVFPLHYLFICILNCVYQKLFFY